MYFDICQQTFATTLGYSQVKWMEMYNSDVFDGFKGNSNEFLSSDQLQSLGQPQLEGLVQEKCLLSPTREMEFQQLYF